MKHIWMIALPIGAVIAYFILQASLLTVLPAEIAVLRHMIKMALPALFIIILTRLMVGPKTHTKIYTAAAVSTALLGGIGLTAELSRLSAYVTDGQGWGHVIKFFDKSTLAGVICAFALCAVAIFHTLKGSNKTKAGAEKAKRAKQTVHGDARFMSMKEAGELFPDGPGICLGERYRPDLDETAGTYFMPDKPDTWGKGGKSPLMCFNGNFGSTHGLIFAGSGAFKTTGLVLPTAIKWPSSMVVLDPSREIAPMVQTHREAAFGKRALLLDPATGTQGFNALDWIERAASKEQAISETANWLAAEKPAGQGGNSEFFATSATQLITGVLAHIMLDDVVLDKNKNLRYLRAIIASPEPKLKEKLEQIHAQSQNAFVRETVGPFIKLAEQTFSGVYATASKDTQWLSFPNFGALVSDRKADIQDIISGGIDVYINIALKDIRNHPGFARVIVGSLLNTIIEADGKIEDRVLFMLDEAVSIGKMKAIETARDQGRKYGITLMLVYQAVGQLKDTWGVNAPSSWAESCTYRIYAGLNDQATAAEVAKAIGSFTVDSKIENKTSSSSNKHLGSITHSAGTNKQQQLQKRDLLMPHEILSDMRLDEQIIFVTGRPPIRCGRPIYFRRPEMVAAVEENRFKV